MLAFKQSCNGNLLMDGAKEDSTDAYSDQLPDLIDIKKVTVSNKKDDTYYNMDHQNRGKAIIFNHEIFDSSPQRFGTNLDCENLTNTLSLLGFEIENYKDLTLKRLEEVLYNTSKMDFQDYDCLLIAILSHGALDTIEAKDKNYSVSMLFEIFKPDVCSSLAGKPKLFFIQACRGSKTDDGIDVEVDSGINSYRLPLYADFLVVFSTFPGFYSWRDPEKGSFFIEALCEVLSKRWKESDLLTMLTFVNQRVAFDCESRSSKSSRHKKKQIPCICHMLTRLIKF